MKKLFKNHYFVAALFLLAVFAVVVIGRNNQEKPLESATNTVARPFSGFFSSMGFWFGGKFEFLTSIGSLKDENEKIYEENLRLKSQLAQLKDIRSENEQLRKQIDLSPSQKYDLAAAVIIGRELSGQDDIYYIDKGRKNGIEEGMAVIVEDGIYIGKIIKATENQSQVELLLGKDSRTNVEVVESSEKGIIKGEFGTSVVLDMIPQTTQLQNGDTIVTSGLSGKIPRGLLVGYVKDVMPSSDQLFQKASVILPANLNKMRIVSVIKNQKISQ